MRTKLDEIVDEEIMPESEHVSATDSLYRDQVLRVAERAFRHGVEQFYREAMKDRPPFEILTVNGKFMSPDGVQSAPAEEKKSTGCRCENHDKCTAHCAVHGCPKFGWFADRRKGTGRTSGESETRPTPERRMGQRRKYGEARNFVHGEGTRSLPIYQTNEWGSFFYDRRSGQDRRKSP